ncbi:MAG: Trk system potassium transporter TrkA, partial [Treponemataceae bacterium]
IQEKSDVVLIERNGKTARHASNRLDCLVIQDEGNNLAALEEAGIAKADAIICVTDSDEINMITCGLASTRNPNILKIARVRNPDYAKLGNTETPVLGIDYLVHPDVEAAKAIIRAIEHGALGDIHSIADTPFELGSIDVAGDSAFAGKTIREFRVLAGVECLVTLIERQEECIIPTGKSVIEAGDRIHVIAREKDLGGIFELSGRKTKSIKRIGIVGGGRIGSLVLEGLSGDGFRKRTPLGKILSLFKPQTMKQVVVIEKDYLVCKDISARFPDILVINEDISDEGFVDEEGISDLDLVVTTTENQELNMIAALYLKKRGIERAVALVNGGGYTGIARSLGIDVVVPLKTVVVDSILSHLMGGGVKSVHRVADGTVEVLELELASETPAVGSLLSALKLPDGSLVMLVTRGGDSFIPGGDCVFTGGDHVVLIVKKGGEADVERVFGNGK